MNWCHQLECLLLTADLLNRFTTLCTESILRTCLKYTHNLNQIYIFYWYTQFLMQTAEYSPEVSQLIQTLQSSLSASLMLPQSGNSPHFYMRENVQLWNNISKMQEFKRLTKKSISGSKLSRILQRKRTEIKLLHLSML